MHFREGRTALTLMTLILISARPGTAAEPAAPHEGWGIIRAEEYGCRRAMVTATLLALSSPRPRNKVLTSAAPQAPSVWHQLRTATRKPTPRLVG